MYTSNVHGKCCIFDLGKYLLWVIVLNTSKVQHHKEQQYNEMQVLQ
jgi:hypothetical protein